MNDVHFVLWRKQSAVQASAWNAGKPPPLCSEDWKKWRTIQGGDRYTFNGATLYLRCDGYDLIARVINETSDAIIYQGTIATIPDFERFGADQTIIAVAPAERVSRQLCHLWGAHRVRSLDIENYEGMVEQALATSREEGFAEVGQTIVVAAGVPFGHAGTTNNLRIVEVT